MKTAYLRASCAALLVTFYAAPGRPQSEQREKRAHLLAPVTTEEGQHVVFDAETWRSRELTKRLPLSEPWPTPEAMPAALRRFGLDTAPMPERVPTPSLIATDIYLVNSVPNNTYLIDAGAEGLILIDPGLSSNYAAIVTAIGKLGFDAKRIRWVLNTHAHFDHSQADWMFRRLGAKLLVGAPDADAIEKGTRTVANWAFPDLTRDSRPTPVDWRVADGEELHLGNKVLTAVRTPGHTEGSTCFYLKVDGKSVLFSGDTILFDYRLALQVPGYSNNRDYSESLRKLASIPTSLTETIRWDMLLSGHGALVLDRAYMDIEKGRESVQLSILNGNSIEFVPYRTPAYRIRMYGRP